MRYKTKYFEIKKLYYRMIYRITKNFEKMCKKYFTNIYNLRMRTISFNCKYL